MVSSHFGIKDGSPKASFLRYQIDNTLILEDSHFSLENSSLNQTVQLLYILQYTEILHLKNPFFKKQTVNSDT